MSLASPPRRAEIDEYAIKFIIGVIAIALPAAVWYLTGGSIDSISQSYWFEGSGWPRNLLVGSLCAIAAFMLAFNGRDGGEMWFAKIGSAAALCVALFPCNCVNGGGTPGTKVLGVSVHWAAAAVLFVVLLYFCWRFWRRARVKGKTGANPQASFRAGVYLACFVGLVTAFALFLISFATKRPNLIFWGETLGLISFGVSWLLASRILPVVTHPSEREHLFVSGDASEPPDSETAPEAARA